MKLYTFNLTGSESSILKKRDVLGNDKFEIDFNAPKSWRLDSSRSEETYNCFIPHHAVVFYNRENKILAYIDVCYLCQDVSSNILDLQQKDPYFYYKYFAKTINPEYQHYHANPSNQFSLDQALFLLKQCYNLGDVLNIYLYQKMKITVPIPASYIKCDYLLCESENFKPILPDTLIGCSINIENKTIEAGKPHGGKYVFDFKGNVISQTYPNSK